MTTEYVLPDEGLARGRIARLAAQPAAVMLSMILAGAWLAVPWLIFNGFAIRSSTRWRDAAVCAALLPVCAAWIALVQWAALVIPGIGSISKYLLLGVPLIQYVVAFKVSIKYAWLAEAHLKTYGTFARPYLLIWGMAVAFFAYMLLDHNSYAYVLLIG